MREHGVERRVLILYHRSLAWVAEWKLGPHGLWREKPLVKLKWPEGAVGRWVRVIGIRLGIVARVLVELVLPGAVLGLRLHCLRILGQLLG